MFKNLIAPVQAWLLSQGKCVGCGMTLDKGEKKGDFLTCKCTRVYKNENGTYRRARFDEVK
jgi:hypothetical protein